MSAESRAPWTTVDGIADASLTPVPQPPDGITITSPSAGRVSLAPKPGAPPFVGVGAGVEPGRVVCLIGTDEAAHEIEADLAGIVAQVFAADGATVAAGPVSSICGTRRDIRVARRWRPPAPGDQRRAPLSCEAASFTLTPVVNRIETERLERDRLSLSRRWYS